LKSIEKSTIFSWKKYGKLQSHCCTNPVDLADIVLVLSHYVLISYLYFYF